MMRHSCPYCAGGSGGRRRVALDYIRTHHNIPSSVVARELRINRTTVVKWRAEAEEVGCVPKRTRKGQAWHPIMRTMQRMPLAPVYPIGTAWWGEETQRVG